VGVSSVATDAVAEKISSSHMGEVSSGEDTFQAGSFAVRGTSTVVEINEKSQ
jgi:hypothetical protein